MVFPEPYVDVRNMCFLDVTAHLLLTVLLKIQSTYKTKKYNVQCNRIRVSYSEVFWKAKDAKFPHADTEDTDQTAKIHKLL